MVLDCVLTRLRFAGVGRGHRRLPYSSSAAPITSFVGFTRFLFSGGEKVRRVVDRQVMGSILHAHVMLATETSTRPHRSSNLRSVDKPASITPERPHPTDFRHRSPSSQTNPDPSDQTPRHTRQTAPDLHHTDSECIAHVNRKSRRHES